MKILKICFLIIFISIVRCQDVEIPKYYCEDRLGNYCKLNLTDHEVNQPRFIPVATYPKFVTSLFICGTQISVFSAEDICDTFPDLERIDVGALSIEEVSKNAFSKCLKLKSISMYRNNISSLDIKLLWNLVDLEILQLTANQLTYIHPKVFKNLKKLRELYVRNNPLINLDADQMVKYMPNLREIYLQDTDIECERMTEIIEVFEEIDVIIRSDSLFNRTRNHEPFKVHGITCLSDGQHRNLINEYLDTGKVTKEDLATIVKLHERHDTHKCHDNSITANFEHSSKNFEALIENVSAILKNVEMKLDAFENKQSGSLTLTNLTLTDLEQKIEKSFNNFIDQKLKVLGRMLHENKINIQKLITSVICK